MKEFFSKIATLLKENKKYQIALIVVVAVLAAGSVWGYYFATGGDFSITEITKNNDEEVVEVNARKLDGVIMGTEEEINPYPVSVMVENLSSVRPQSGISSASVVYEALAEGGITRFMLVFPGDKSVASNIGPVRSARSYYLEWVSEYDALYAFSGAYPPVLAAVSGLKIKSMNAMYDGSKYYWRDHSFSAPHNMFTSSENLGYAVRDKGLEDEEAKFRAWKFKDEAALEDRPIEEKTISIDFSGAAYGVEFRYDRESNNYLRFNAGAEHTDRNTSEQLAPKNVVVYKLPTRTIDDYGRLEMDVIGEGEATMFSDGVATKGTWKKSSRTDRTLFYNENGEEYEFSRGQTWVDVVPDDKGYEHN
ncbi:MAG: DUF3048 domain-containing protein [Parcubacteria group bacterium]|nr:DUF3048 domain-containing protein [Parcubacteria group bacterium]